jgi:hypothetical protein
MEFIASLVQSLAWPAAAFGAVLLFRTKLVELLLNPALKRLKAGIFEAEWERNLAVTQADLEQPGIDASELYPSGPLSKELASLAQTLPAAAVVEAAGRVEQKVRAMLEGQVSERELKTGLAGLARLALQNNVINAQTARSIEGLAVLRNLSVHGQSTTAEQAAEYLNIVDGILYILG